MAEKQYKVPSGIYARLRCQNETQALFFPLLFHYVHSLDTIAHSHLSVTQQ